MDHLIIVKDNKECIVTSDKKKCSVFVNYFSSFFFINELDLIEDDIVFETKTCRIDNININEDMIITKIK